MFSVYINFIKKMVTTKERYKKFIAYFSEHLPSAKTELNYENPYQLAVAVILSAQCTDKRVNMVTVALFKRFPTVFDMAKADVEEIFNYIKSVSYTNNKAKHLSGFANDLVVKYNGEIPADRDKLEQLPGVGRKTANVIASVAFDIPTMPVDTHVFRVANRIGLTKDSKTPAESEKQLVANIPSDKLNLSHHWLILHGRYVCIARKPKCEICGLSKFCKFVGN